MANLVLDKKSEADMIHKWNLRWKARTDLIWLCHKVLDYNLISPKVHGPMLESLQQFKMPSKDEAREKDLILGPNIFQYTPGDPYTELEGGRRKVLLFSRGYYKTTTNTIAHTIQWLLNYPQIGIALLFSTDDKAKKVLGPVRSQFQFNARLRDLFPDFCPTMRKVNDFGNNENFTLPNREGVLNRLHLPPRVEPSVMSQSLEKSKAGFHFDLIKCSDIVDEQMVELPQQRALTEYQFGLLPKLLVKRYDGKDGWLDVEGTFYHPEDLHVKLCKDWAEKLPHERRWSVFVRGCFERDTGTNPPKYDPSELFYCDFKKDENGKRVPTWPEADPIEKLEAEEKDIIEGGRVFYCTPGYGKILMSDWSEKPIKDVQIGEEVIGFTYGPKDREQTGLIKSIVTDKGSHRAEVWELTTSTGQKVYSTKEHLWFTGRSIDKTHPSPFGTPKIGRKMMRVYYPPTEPQTPRARAAWTYLGGMVDGAGSVTGYNLTVSQDSKVNQGVCNTIAEALKETGLDHQLANITTRPDFRTWWIKGGRSARIALLKNCEFLGKADKIREQLWKTASRNVCEQLSGREKIVSMRSIGEDEVFWLTTTSGNYVSQSFASKNCQRVLDPFADKSSERPFAEPLTWVARDDFKSVPIDYHITTIDLADTTNKRSNFSVITTCAYDRAGRCYVHNIQRGKWNPDETIERIFEVHNKFLPVKMIIEDYAYVHGLRPSIERYASRMGVYPNFHYEPAGRTTDKVSRIIKALQPPLYTGLQGHADLRFVDPLDTNPEIAKHLKTILQREFTECTVFSTGSSDDILDTLANQYLCRDWFGKEGLRGGIVPQEAAAIARIQREQYDRAWREMLGMDPSPKQAKEYQW